jgi:hypothetical protein
MRPAYVAGLIYWFVHPLLAVGTSAFAVAYYALTSQSIDSRR